MNNTNCDMPNDVDWSEIEIYRIEFEYLKHLTTICTGSILLMVAFLEKLFSKPEWKCAVVVSLCSFIASIILCAISQMLIIDKVSERRNIRLRDIVQRITTGILLLALFSYVLGIISLAMFGIKNIL